MNSDALRDVIEDVKHLLDGDWSRREIEKREAQQQQPASPVSREEALEETARTVSSCRRCGLAETRTMAVPGYGVLDPLVMVIGEAPGSEEDRQGLPFVGAAGQYLDKWLAAIGLERGGNVFIGNIIKCRPPQNRDPFPQEQQACLPFLKDQISIVRPKVLLCVGRISAQILLAKTDGIGRLRGSVYEFQGVPLVPTYHPSGVLRNPEYRRPVWEDLKQVRSLLDE